MLSAFLGSPSPKVEVSLVHELVIIPPNLDGEATPPSLSGVVTVHLPTRRKAQRLYVTLEGKAELHASGKWPAEKETVFRRLVELPLGKEELDIGDHVFAFKIDIPPTTLIRQRTPFGYVMYNVTGLLELSPKSTITSKPKRAFILAVSFHGDYPPPFELVHEHLSPDLGPVRIQLFSPHLATSSLVHLRLFLPSTPTLIQLESIRLSVIQSIDVDYRDPTRPRKPAPSTYPLLFVNTEVTPPATSDCKLLGVDVHPEEEWEGTAIFRLPHERQIRASSVDGSAEKFHVTHHLFVELHYMGSGGRRRTYGIELPVAVGHCMSMPGSWFLPEYSSLAPDTRVKRTAELTLCLCEYSVSEVLDLYGEVLKVGGERQLEVPTAGGASEETGETVRPIKSAAVQV